MTKAARIKRLKLETSWNGIPEWRWFPKANRRLLLDYYHAVNQEAIELATKAGTTAGMHRAAMQRVMKQIGIKVK